MPQLPLALAPPRRQRFANFVGDGNRPLLATLRHCVGDGEWYLLAGPAGSGKTHIALALEHEWGEKDLSVRYLPAASERVADLLDPPGGEGQPPDCAIVDGIDALAGQAGAERALFNALNRWRAARVTVLLTGRGPFEFELPDLGSRIGQAARLTLKPLLDAELGRLLEQLFDDLHLTPGRGLSEYLLRHGPRAPAELVVLFRRLARRAQAERRPASIRMARECIAAGPQGRDGAADS